VVDVAIINWNTASAALEAAESLLTAEGVDTQVKVVDNLSAEPERELLRKCPEQERLELILSNRNLGFGAAANLALSLGSADLVCVSNADAVPAPSALRELAEVAANRPDAGMVGPVFEGPTHRYHAALPGPTTLLARIFFGSAGTRAAPVPAAGEVVEVGQASGAFFVMRRQVWEALGGFDERFFLWYEDVDLAKRVVAAGRHNLVVGSARVAHKGAASFEQLDSRTAQAIRLDSLGSYIDKSHPRLAPLARPLLATSRALRARGGSAAELRGLRAGPDRR
jgi:N-acetylglucosaminyl-diphospho-decaprenol L-rhamnosyltransferase